MKVNTSHTLHSLHSYARDMQRVPRTQTRFRVAIPRVNPGSEPVQPPRLTGVWTVADTHTGMAWHGMVWYGLGLRLKVSSSSEERSSSIFTPASPFVSRPMVIIRHKRHRTGVRGPFMPDTRHHGLSPTRPEFLHLFLHSISAKTIYKYDADSFRHSEHLRIAPRSGYATARCADDRAQGKPGPKAGAHDAGIDYGVLAADIAAENSHVLTCVR